MSSCALPSDVQPPLALYIHIPFCASCCPFCDFFKVVERRVEQHRLLVQRLLEQLAHVAANVELGQVETAFIGGGTPTLLGPDLIITILTALRVKCPKLSEVTIESNPEILQAPMLRALNDYGVSRISLGLQSSHDHLLRKLGRRNSYRDNLRAAELLQQSWGGETSFDFIYASSGQHLDDLEKYFNFIRQFQPYHVSWYQLTVEENTPFANYQRQ